MKKVWTLLFVLLAFQLVAFAQQPPQKAPAEKPKVAYVGSSRSNKFHKPSCRYAKKIRSYNLVTFPSKKEAEDKGYVACKVCKP